MKVDADTVKVVLGFTWMPGNIVAALLVGKPVAWVFMVLAMAPIVVVALAIWLAFIIMIRTAEDFGLMVVFGVPFLLWMFGVHAGLVVIAISAASVGRSPPMVAAPHA